MQPTRIIAEAGVNHDGKLERALGLVEAAATAGADAVKFQTFTAEALASSRADTATYQRHSGETGNQVDMLSRLELSRDDHKAVFNACRDHEIDFLSSPFDLSSLNFLTSELKVSALKIASGEITNGPLLTAAARTGLPLFVSTGMATLEEVDQAVRLVSSSDERGPLTLLHCTSRYPCPPEDINLRAMHTLSERFSVPVGFSDHSLGVHVAPAAVAMGARVIEKHLTLDRTAVGPDHAASIEASEFKSMVRAIRDVEQALGSSIKAPTPGEREARQLARKSIVANQNIEEGKVFEDHLLDCKRPGDGLSPMLWQQLLGRRARHTYSEGDAINPDELNNGELDDLKLSPHTRESPDERQRS